VDIVLFDRKHLSQDLYKMFNAVPDTEKAFKYSFPFLALFYLSKPDESFDRTDSHFFLLG
jgi:hypothetical protein